MRLFGCFLCAFLVLLGVVFAFFGVKTAWRAANFGMGSGQRSAARRAVYNIIIYIVICIFFLFSCANSVCTERKKIKDDGVVKANRTGTDCGLCRIWPFLWLFSLCGQRKNEKKDAAREPGRGTAGGRRDGGGRAAAWLEVCRRCSWRLLWS